MRIPNTTRTGQSFSPLIIAAVWNKGRVIPNFDAAVWRWDACGNVMKRSEHGNTDSKYGWEIDHIVPVAHYGSDDLSNLQPLQWQNNRAKSDGPLVCAATA